MSFAADTQLGPYKIISLIGAGGMGEVYRAHDTRLLRDGKTLLVAPVHRPTVIFALDTLTGQRKPYRTMLVPDGLHAQDLSSPLFAPDLKSYVYSYTRIASDLYVVEELK